MIPLWAFWHPYIFATDAAFYPKVQSCSVSNTQDLTTGCVNQTSLETYERHSAGHAAFQRCTSFDYSPNPGPIMTRFWADCVSLNPEQSPALKLAPVFEQGVFPGEWQLSLLKRGQDSNMWLQCRSTTGSLQPCGLTAICRRRATSVFQTNHTSQFDSRSGDVGLA